MTTLWHAPWGLTVLLTSQDCFNIMMPPYQYRSFYIKGKTVWHSTQPSFLYNGNPNTWNDSLYTEMASRSPCPIRFASNIFLDQTRVDILVTYRNETLSIFFFAESASELHLKLPGTRAWRSSLAWVHLNFTRSLDQNHSGATNMA